MSNVKYLGEVPSIGGPVTSHAEDLVRLARSGKITSAMTFVRFKDGTFRAMWGTSDAEQYEIIGALEMLKQSFMAQAFEKLEE